MRTGEQYIESLRDGRQVFVDGERIEDVTTHPSFAAPIRRVADLYDSRRDRSDFRIDDPEGDGSYDAMWHVPRTVEELGLRRQVHRFWAEDTYGLMGRTPDHVASVLTGFAGSADVFDRESGQFADHVRGFHRRARREELYVSYVIVPPQVDRSKPAHQQPEPFLYAGVSKERDDGIVLRGAQMIGTAALMSDYVLLTYITPLQAGDEDYGVSVVLPANAPGLRLYPRRPYADIATSVVDYPLSSRFDETDSLVVLDDVFVPWEQVFVYRDPEACRAQFFDTGAHQLANFQSLVRFSAKLDFISGLARKLAEMHGIEPIPPVRAMLGGQLAAYCTAIQAITAEAERNAQIDGGWAKPHGRYVYSGMSLQRRLVVDLMRTLRELAGGAFLSVPSSVDNFASPETAEHTERYYRSATASSRERVKLLKLMWDMVGTEYAGRQLQYEMFYSAAQHVVDMRLYGHYGWERGVDLVDRCLAEYDYEADPQGASA